jgi:hypothetical protein
MPCYEKGDVRIRYTVNQVRDFLRAHQPVTATR